MKAAQPRAADDMSNNTPEAMFRCQRQNHTRDMNKRGLGRQSIGVSGTLNGHFHRQADILTPSIIREEYTF